MERYVVIGGAEIRDYERIRSYLRDDDFVVYCDSGLRHLDSLGAEPSLVVGDFDSHPAPQFDVETIVLPVAKDDTDTVYAVREGISRGFTEFLLIGVFGARMDHTLVNVYILFDLDSRGLSAMAVDDYSEFEVISSRRNSSSGAPAEVGSEYPYFSLVNMTGTARGVTIRNARFPLENGEITSEYQYATSNEALPGKTAGITVEEGRLLLIRDV